MANTSIVTTREDLARIAKDRGRVYDPRRQFVWCSYCAAPLTVFGLVHTPDCAGEEGEILFRDLD